MTGGVAVYLSQQGNDNLKRFACIFGAIGQPFWWYSTLQAEQYGMFALTLLYTYEFKKRYPIKNATASAVAFLFMRFL